MIRGCTLMLMYLDKTKQNFAVNKPGEMDNNRNGMDSAELYLIRQSKQFGYEREFSIYIDSWI